MGLENPEVRKALKVVLAVEPEEIREALQRNTVAMLEFTTEAYRRLYG